MVDFFPDLRASCDFRETHDTVHVELGLDVGVLDSNIIIEFEPLHAVMCICFKTMLEDCLAQRKFSYPQKPWILEVSVRVEFNLF